MSRIGKQPVIVPAGVTVSINGRTVTVEASGKKLSMEHRPEVRVAWSPDERHVTVTIDEKDAEVREVRAYWGLTRALINSMIIGVTKGYQKQLEVNGVGWGATLAGKNLDLKLGFANTIRVAIPAGLDVTVDKTIITIKGPDKQLVGQFAAQVRAKRKPEPYNGKGIKYTDEVIRRKQGKAFGA